MARPPRRTRATAPESITVRPANEASWDEVSAVFGARGEASKCLCQRVRLRHSEWRSIPITERADRLRRQTRCGHADAAATSGLIAHLDGEPVGWCAVEPRTAFARLLYSPLPWTERSEDKADASVWAAPCFITRAGFRRRGVSYALARALPEFARARGARAIEGYPMIVPQGQEIAWGELNCGSRSIFAAAGFAEASRPAQRRVVMRIDFSVGLTRP